MGRLARISTQQLVVLVYTLHFSATELLLPSSLARTGHSGGWLAPLLSFFLASFPVALMLGRLPGRLLTLLAGLFNLVLTALCLRDVVELIPVAILPATPPLAVAVPFIVVATYGAYCGAEVLARLSFFFVVTAIVILVLGITTLTELLSPYRLLPLWEQSPVQLFGAAWPTTGWYAESWSFFPLAAMTDQPQLVWKGLTLGALLAAFHLMCCTAMAIGVFGHELVANFAFPIFALFQQITIGEFVERLDVILISICLLGMLVKTAAHLWLAAGATGFGLGMANHRPLLPALGLVAVVLMWLIPNLPWLFIFSTTLWIPFSLGLGYGVPALLLAASWIRTRQGRQPNMQT